MITKEKLKIFEEYKGNVDEWLLTSNHKDTPMKDTDWVLIKEIVQRLSAVAKGKASKEFTEKTGLMISRHVDQESLDDLMNIIAKF
jgi:hypothetical protein